MKQQYILLFVIVVFCIRCKKLEQLPQATASQDAVFSSEKGLELYTNSFYRMLPTANNIITTDNVSDYGARRDVPRFIRDGAYSSNVSDNTSASAYDLVALGLMTDNDWNWGWRSLRNVNYFIANNTDPRVTEDIRRHYTGVARFFRAFFYFEKVKRYGDVPWVGKPLDVDDPALFSARDSRTLVMDSVLADLNYAADNIKTVSDPSRTMITKWVAQALKARICLFEGTFRKYHTNLNLVSSANTWLTEAANTSLKIMNESGYKLYEGAGVAQSYRKVFTSAAPVGEEVMLAA